MTTARSLRLITLGAIVTIAACADAPSAPVAIADANASARGGGTTLYFSGVDANTSTPLGTVLTTQIDNIEVDVMARFDGPNAASSHQMLYYNGHGGVSGWGIILLNAAHGFPDGSIGILQGGIDIPMTGLVMTPGVWHHISARRHNQVITVTLDDVTVNLGPRGVNPVGGGFSFIERTTVGGDGTFDSPTGNFNGAIDRVRVRDLNTDAWIERWNFNAGEGPTGTGVNGTVLHLGNTVWARRGNP